MRQGDEIPATEKHLRLELRATLDHARHDAAVFAVLTVILTPAFVTLVVILLFFALVRVDLPFIDDLGYSLSFVTGVNLSLAFMVVSYFLRPKAPYQRQKSDVKCVALGLTFLCALLGFSYATSLATSQPLYFWLVYLLLAFAMLGCIGHAYEPREDYYLGWIIAAPAWIIDNPFIVEDDIDRTHFMLGFVAGLSNMIMRSYSAMFGSTWLWRRLDYGELAAAVDLLQALARSDSASARDRMQTLSKTSALAVVRALVKLEMITIDRGTPRLLLKGREFLALKSSQ